MTANRTMTELAAKVLTNETNRVQATRDAATKIPWNVLKAEQRRQRREKREAERAHR